MTREEVYMECCDVVYERVEQQNVDPPRYLNYSDLEMWIVGYNAAIRKVLSAVKFIRSEYEEDKKENG